MMHKAKLYLLLALGLVVCAFMSENGSKVEGTCQIVASNTVCPDNQRCAEICSACYVGKGQVTSLCNVGPGGAHQCICVFSHGAPSPCDGSAPRRCPPSQAEMIHFNITTAVEALSPQTTSSTSPKGIGATGMAFTFISCLILLLL